MPPATSVPALVYHKVAEIPPGARFPENHVRPAEFRRQLAFLRSGGFTSISFADYLAYRRGEGLLPRRPILITFDDGYRSNLDVALPILAEFGFTATVFLVAGCIGGTNAWDADERQEPLLGRDDIREMRRAGIEFQSHTFSHARLTHVREADARRELLESRLALEELVEAPVRVVAYPWGAYDSAVERLALETGYEAGAIVRRRLNFPDTPITAVRRIGVNHQTRLRRFAWDLLRLRWRGD